MTPPTTLDSFKLAVKEVEVAHENFGEGSREHHKALEAMREVRDKLRKERHGEVRTQD